VIVRTQLVQKILETTAYRESLIYRKSWTIS
jgi:hypothetical protein